MELYLIRHTAPDIAAGICYGQSDVDVAQSFPAELEQVRNKLAHVIPARIYSSPLQRCSKLAEALALGEVRHDARLKELDFGDWELKRWNDIPRGLVDVWAEDHVMQAPPKGESFHALYLRAKHFLHEVSTNPSEQTVLVFTHAGVIRALLSEALNLQLTDTFRLQIDYSGVTQITVDNGAMRVAYVNR